MVAYIGRLAGGVGDVYIMVEDAHGESDLCQFAVAHDDIGLEAAVLRRTHTGEVDAVFRLPIMFLEIAQVISHHGDVCPPFFLQTDEHSHADGMDACLPHTVETVDTPFKLGLHAAGVVDVVIRFVIGFLKTNHTVHAVLFQLCILFRF